MSARDELESNILAGNLDCPGCIRIAIDTMLSEHAHELAEKIRDIPSPSHWNEPTAEAIWENAREEAAAVIDPEVES